MFISVNVKFVEVFFLLLLLEIELQCFLLLSPTGPFLLSFPCLGLPCWLFLESFLSFSLFISFLNVSLETCESFFKSSCSLYNISDWFLNHKLHLFLLGLRLFHSFRFSSSSLFFSRSFLFALLFFKFSSSLLISFGSSTCFFSASWIFLRC